MSKKSEEAEKKARKSEAAKKRRIARQKKTIAANQKAEKFLEAYINTPTPVGHEQEGQRVWLSYVDDFIDPRKGDDIIFGPHNSVAVKIKGKNENFKLAIEAHVDEISWRVQRIHDATEPEHKEGTLGIVGNGGTDPLAAVTKRVHVYTQKGIIKGVVGLAAIHAREDETEAAPAHELFVDIYSDTDVETKRRGVRCGDLVMFTDTIEEMGDKNEYYVGRSLDNKMGGYILSQVIRNIKEQNIVLPYTVYFVNSSQEETGSRGARQMVRKIKPNLAICIDGTHDTQTRGYDRHKMGDIWCGRGPTLAVDATTDNKFKDLILSTAKKRKIPTQLDGSGDGTSTGTDADIFADYGAVTALVSVPMRYMHTTVESVHKRDVKQTVALLTETLKDITGKPDQLDKMTHLKKKWEERKNKANKSKNPEPT